jgi:hypothetical protein
MGFLFLGLLVQITADVTCHYHKCHEIQLRKRASMPVRFPGAECFFLIRYSLFCEIHLIDFRHSAFEAHCYHLPCQLGCIVFGSPEISPQAGKYIHLNFDVSVSVFRHLADNWISVYHATDPYTAVFGDLSWISVAVDRRIPIF